MFKTKNQFEDELGRRSWPGRSPESMVFDEQSTGASNDIERATRYGPAHGHRVRDERERSGRCAFGKKDELVFLGREISEQRNYSRRDRVPDRSGDPRH